MNYDIQSLIDTFQLHADRFDKDLMDNKDKYLDLPDGYDFNLPRALLEICKKLNERK